MCEKERPATERERWLCERRKCKNEYRRFPAYYRPFHLGSRTKAAKQLETEQKTLKPNFRCLRHWRWIHLQSSDDDWNLINQKGEIMAMVRQEDVDYWMAKPKVLPYPPLESFDKAQQRAVNYSLMALPSKMPTQPSSLFRENMRSKSALDFERRHGVSNYMRQEGTASNWIPSGEGDIPDIPKFLKR